MALGLGMKVIAADSYIEGAKISVDFYNGQSIDFDIKTQPIEDLLKNSDFITLHVPAQKDYIIAKKEFDIMKNGVFLINCSRGGIINEVDLVAALEANKVVFAGLDVFENEPTPAVQLLMNPKISLTPHIGAATLEAQERISIELADQIIALLKV
jgi:D-3-phosphoglycerate dehydrogenase / 2-oxoglutarate reductase